MARHTLLQTMLAVVVVLSLTAALQADTRIVFSHSGSHLGLGIALGTRIGPPIVAPHCPPPVRHHREFGPPVWHRPIRYGPPCFGPVMAPAPVVRHVVVQPAPTVIVGAGVPVQDVAITVWVTNSNGSQTSVRLTREGGWYVGPRGEYYSEMPTNEQLRVAYGF
ncbi:MAG: hypothetical protein ABFD90_08305 [Phycisphaerales bacterium]